MNRDRRAAAMSAGPELDHAAQAAELVRMVGRSAMTSDAALVSVMAAQVHATLALVESQDRANEIAGSR